MNYSTTTAASDDDSWDGDEDLVQSAPDDLKIYSIDTVCPRPMLGDKIAIRTNVPVSVVALTPNDIASPGCSHGLRRSSRS